MPEGAQRRTAAQQRLTVARATLAARARGPAAADIAAIAAGGGIGTVARYLLSQAFPAGHGFPWAIFAINVSGCFATGLVMVYLLDVWPPRRLLRPFLAIGLIGGYTTFSTYSAGILTLIQDHALARADAYALSSVAAGLVAVFCGVAAARRMSAAPHRNEPSASASGNGRGDRKKLGATTPGAAQQDAGDREDSRPRGRRTG
jgi:CrcB protein